MACLFADHKKSEKRLKPDKGRMRYIWIEDRKEQEEHTMVKAVLIGAGLRGSEAYASYALEYPNELQFTAVAEVDDERRIRFAGLHNIPENRQYKDYRELLAEEKMADCALVCTQDHMHYEPVILALEKGYHVLCEKPMSPVREEIIKMGQMAEKYGRILQICHVLRYSPFFVKIKELLDGRRIGQLISIQHIEEVGYWHFAHSFVRGNWRNSRQSSPVILAKCCHDMDILLWLAGSACTSVSSYGDLTHFRKENAPEGAPHYCMDGCRYRDECPYYAPRFYLTHERAVKDHLIQAVSMDISRKAVLEKLRKGPYGRCVYHCDNDVADHQTVNLQFENGVDVSFEMCAFTKACNRRINLMGTHGQIMGDMEAGRIVLYDFARGHEETIDLNTPAEGHGGSDSALMKEFIQLVESGSGSGKTDAALSVESHLIALAAEQSRVEGHTIKLAGK